MYLNDPHSFGGGEGKCPNRRAAKKNNIKIAAKYFLNICI